MVKIEDLHRINLLKGLPEHLLQTIAKEAQLSIFGTNTELIRVNEPQDTFYMLIMGQVAIKQEITPEIDVILDYIQSGSSFGSSAFMEGSMSSYTAVCHEPSEVITLSGHRMIQMFREDHELAYYVMLGVARQYKKNMDVRARMIMKTLDENPGLKKEITDIKNLILAI